jgi:hypothetical protein
MGGHQAHAEMLVATFCSMPALCFVMHQQTRYGFICSPNCCREQAHKASVQAEPLTAGLPDLTRAGGSARADTC